MIKEHLLQRVLPRSEVRRDGNQIASSGGGARGKQRVDGSRDCRQEKRGFHEIARLTVSPVVNRRRFLPAEGEQPVAETFCAPPGQSQWCRGGLGQPNDSPVHVPAGKKFLPPLGQSIRRSKGNVAAWRS